MEGREKSYERLSLPCIPFARMKNQRVAVTNKERRCVWKVLKKFFTLLP
jgi:hypothetical protein